MVACELKTKPLDNDDEGMALIEIQRYDRIQSRYLTTGDFSALQQMSTGFPMETRLLIEDVLAIGEVDDAEINSKLLNFFQDSIAQNLIIDTETKYTKVDDINKQLTNAFLKLKNWFPDLKIPMFYTQISGLRQSIIVSDDAVGISLDKYLGADYPLYERYYNEEQRAIMNKENIVPDCLSFYLISQFPLEDFEIRTQEERDTHMAKIQWIVNKAMEKQIFKNNIIETINSYMQKNKHITPAELLK